MNAGQGSIASDFPIAAGTVPAGIAESGTGIVAGRIRLGINPLLAITNIDGNGFPVIFRNAGIATPFSVLNTTTLSQWNFQTDTDPFLQEWFGIVANQNVFCAMDGSINTGFAQLQLRTTGAVMIGAGAQLAKLTVANNIAVYDNNLGADVSIVFNNTLTVSTINQSNATGRWTFIAVGAGPIGLGVNALERVTIGVGASGGLVGINKLVPVANLDVVGNGNFTNVVTINNPAPTTGAQFNVFANIAGNTRITVRNLDVTGGSVTSIVFTVDAGSSQIFLANAAGGGINHPACLIVRGDLVNGTWIGCNNVAATANICFFTNGLPLAVNIKGVINNAGNWILNNGTNVPADTGEKLQITGQIRTDQGVMTVAPVGWRLGNNKVAAAVMDATQYVEVELAGALVKLARIV